jgi:hypothetical protein
MDVKYSLYLILVYLLGVLCIKTINLCVRKLMKILTYVFRKNVFVYGLISQMLKVNFSTINKWLKMLTNWEGGITCRKNVLGIILH